MVVVHDAARPLVTRDLVERCLDALEPGVDGAIAAVPMTDTVKEAAPDGRVVRTLDRSALWAVQTPQVFRADVAAARARRDAAALAAATDDASLVEDAGGRDQGRRVVSGEPQGHARVRPAHRRGARLLTDYHVHLRPGRGGLAPPSATSPPTTSSATARPRPSAGSRSSAWPSTSTASCSRWTSGSTPGTATGRADDLDEYCDFVRESRAAGSASRRTSCPGREDRVANLLDGRPWDYVVGSVHFMGDEAVDVHGEPDWEAWDIWRGARPREGVGALLRDARRGGAQQACSTSWPTPTW